MSKTGNVSNEDTAGEVDKMGKVGKALRFVRDIPRKTAVGLIRFYSRAISPALPPSCRFLPTCSEYALTAFQRYGFLKGFVLSVKRIGRCHPWNPGGYDPVP